MSAGGSSGERVELERALGLFDQLPAPSWAARVRAGLARLGHQPAPGELSATKARIAELAAAGRSNPDIAAEVFVSRKTVEANLSRIYRTLGVSSRLELGRRFGGGSIPTPCGKGRLIRTRGS